MKKLLFGCLIFLTACLPPSESQHTTPQPIPTVTATATRLLPTPIPATATVTITPPSTSTPQPPSRYFTEEFDSAPVYWSTLYASGDASRVEVLNNDSKLTFELYSPITWIYAIYGAFEYERVHIETHVESRGSEINSMGLVCHYGEQDGWYEFNLSNDGTYSVLFGHWLAEGIADYIPILIDKSEYIQTGNAINKMGLDCYENIVQLYINSKIIRKLDVAHIGLTSGKVGLSLASFEELPVILTFDWMKVSEP